MHELRRYGAAASGKAAFLKYINAVRQPRGINHHL